MGFEFFILGMTAHDRLLPSFPLIRNAPRPLDEGPCLPFAVRTRLALHITQGEDLELTSNTISK